MTGAQEYRVLSGVAEFEGQTVTVTAHARSISGAAAPAASPPVRVSDDGHMAIEDTNLAVRQPKVFYASNAVWTASNVALNTAGSGYRLYADRANALEVTLPDGVTTRQLDRVLPTVAGGGGAAAQGLTMTIGPDCIIVAEAIMRHAGGARVPHLPFAAGGHTDFGEYRTARALSKWIEFQGWFMSWGKTAMQVAEEAYHASLGTTATAMSAALSEIAVSYANLKATQPLVAEQAAQALGLNVHAQPDVGEAYETYTVVDVAHQVPQSHRDAGLGFDVRDFWGQHIGAVVARSGGDRVTLENYARTYELGSMQADSPHYYFQMYGPATKPAQTWHAAWTAGPGHVGAPVGTPAGLGNDALTGVVRHR